MLPVLISFHPCSLLLLLLGISQIFSTCSSCFGESSGCKGDSVTCPWVTGVAANVTALAGATAISIMTLLPARLLRIFTRQTIAVLASIYRRPLNGVPLDLTKPTPKALCAAVLATHCTKNEALMEIGERMELIDRTKTGWEGLVKSLEISLEVLKNLIPTPGTGSVDGAFMYILARLSQVVCKASSSFELCTETAASSDDDASRRASSRASSALARPRSIFQLMSLLNHFVTVCQATGVASALAMTLFLDDVIYEPLRLGDVSWPVAFEMFLAYIAMVEREPALWSLTSVVVKSGAMDSKRAAALTLAKEKYPAVCFRGERLETNPSDDAHTKDPKFRGDKTKDKDAEYVGTISGFTSTSKRGCTAFNTNKPHLNKHVSNGRCLFMHGCDQFVTDKGPGGMCLDPGHVRADCRYDSAKKCASAHK